MTEQRIIVPVQKIIPCIDVSGLKSIDEAQAIIDKLPKYTCNGLFGKFDYQEQPFGLSFLADYAGSIYRSLLHSKEKGERISDLFKNQIFVDLGAGDLPYGYEIAQLAGAKAYVGVEPFYPKSLEGTIMWDHVPKKIPASVVPEDMLTFLKRLPESSVSLFISGIDGNILPDKGYIDCVENEIMRVLDPKGILFTNDLRPDGLKRDEKSSAFGLDRIYRKEVPSLPNLNRICLK